MYYYVLLAVGNGTWAQSSSSRILIPPFIYSTVSSASELKSIQDFNFKFTLQLLPKMTHKFILAKAILNFSKWKISWICLNFIFTWKLGEQLSLLTLFDYSLFLSSLFSRIVSILCLLISEFWSVAKVMVRIRCATWNSNLESCLLWRLFMFFITCYCYLLIRLNMNTWVAFNFHCIGR